MFALVSLLQPFAFAGQTDRRTDEPDNFAAAIDYAIPYNNAHVGQMTGQQNAPGARRFRWTGQTAMAAAAAHAVESKELVCTHYRKRCAGGAADRISTVCPVPYYKIN